MKRIIILFIFLCSLSIKANAQSIQSLVDELSKYHEVTTHSSGIAGTVSPQYALFMKLDNQASDSELIPLLDNSNPVVVAYAYWAIDDKSEIDMDKILEDNPIKDTTVTFINGCFGSEQTLSELIEKLKLQPVIKW